MMTIGLILCNKLLKHVHPKYILALGLLLHLVGTVTSILVPKFYQFYLLYGIVGGLGIGLAYMVPVYMAWLHFPDRKGLVSGIIFAGFGTGTFLFCLLSTMWVNPYNLQTNPDQGDSLGVQIIYYYFETILADRVPSMFFKMCACWAGLTILSIIMISIPKKKDLRVLRENLLKADTSTVSVTTRKAIFST